jgi:hypothetical protein
MDGGAKMRGPGGIVGVVVLIWLLIGVFATYQRQYFTGQADCAKAGTIALTIITGPLNYFGVNPKVQDCHIDQSKVPQPSQ